MILFQENWEQEVRDYLKPFLVTLTTSPENIAKFNINVYKLEIVQKKPRTPQSEDNTHWGEFLLENIRFHHLTVHYAEVISRITWANKSDCHSPMCFLAAAMLIENNFDLTVGRVLVSDKEALRIFSHEYQKRREDCPYLILSPEESWFPYTWDINPVVPSDEPKLTEFVRYRWGSNGQPLPSVTQPKELRHWQIEDDWWVQMVLFETEGHFIWWNWMLTT